MVDGVLEVVLRNGVFAVDDLQLSPLLKGVLLEAEQVENAAQGLQREEQRGWYRPYGWRGVPVGLKNTPHTNRDRDRSFKAKNAQPKGGPSC